MDWSSKSPLAELHCHSTLTCLPAFRSPSETEPISAAQSTLLKLYDAHAQTHAAPSPPVFLVPTSIKYMTYISTAMSAAVNEAKGASPFSDVRFGKVYEALVLVLQGLLRVGLAERETEEVEVEELGKGEEGEVVQAMKASGRDAGGEAGGVIGRSIELLGLADVIQPRLIRTKPISEIPEDPETAPPGFAHLRRDLVRILGLLSYGDKDIQDRVREAGGLEMVLSLCGMDESHPCKFIQFTDQLCSFAYARPSSARSDLREHALFTARCLLVGNVESQERVKELKPLGVVDEDGKLGDMPERWKNAQTPAS